MKIGERNEGQSGEDIGQEGVEAGGLGESMSDGNEERLGLRVGATGGGAGSRR